MNILIWYCATNLHFMRHISAHLGQWCLPQKVQEWRQVMNANNLEIRNIFKILKIILSCNCCNTDKQFFRFLLMSTGMMGSMTMLLHSFLLPGVRWHSRGILLEVHTYYINSERTERKRMKILGGLDQTLLILRNQI